MKADVRIIRLTRKIIRDQNNMQALNNTKQDDFFATDYFDVMKVEKKGLSSPFTSVMGIWPDEKMDIFDVAAQSYSLYCSSKMLELEKGKKECGDPFSVENRKEKMPFLSMIQVHITPEVMAHALAGKSGQEVLEAVYQDLHTVVTEYVRECKGTASIFRIYKMLSAGDFAVMLRSSEANISFQVFSLLRRRVMTGSEGKRLVLYKTYSLLTLGNDIIRQEVEGHEENSIELQDKVKRKDRFVLRCCYSNLYWSNKEKVDRFLKENDVLSEVKLYGLNGRYDFSVRVTEKQFLELLQDIKAYKETGTWLPDDKSEEGIVTTEDDSPTEDGIIKYMRYLMENKYLSYINERYLIAQEDHGEETDIARGNDFSKKIYSTPIKSREEFLDYRINDIYNAVADKCQERRRELSKVFEYRKNMKHYMNLLDKLIKLCQGINGFSDTRIYAAVLLDQLDVIMDSIHIYIEMYREAEDREEILDFLEDYIRESVCALDGYAQHIRNNNLQSLQTPNYNIESNTSMEKLLIGYSEFLKVFTEFYQRRAKDWSSIESRHQYLPIVVPVMSRRDLSVEVLFPEGFMNDWEKEKAIRKRLNKGENRYCMVISVPTLMELGNISTMITSLFHEVAHQFRYEDRQKRNDALLKYVIHTVMRDIAEKLVQKLQSDIGRYDWNKSFARILEGCLTEAYLETNYKDEKGEMKYYFQETPLKNFESCLRRDTYKILGHWRKKDNIKLVFQTFLKEIMYYYHQIKEDKCAKVITTLDNMFDKIKEDQESYQEEQAKEIEKCAYGLAWECARLNVEDDIDSIWGSEESDFQKWLEEEEEFAYEEEWENAFGNISLDSERSSDKIWHIFYRFACWIYDHCDDGKYNKGYNDKRKTRFLEKAYEKVCDKWNGEMQQEESSKDPNSIYPFIGRALGIDYDTKENREIFVSEIASAINQNFINIIDMISWRIRKYREETADMFMCNAMDLTPFGYMNMLAVSWPGNQKLTREYYERSLNVLLFQWCLDDKKLCAHKFRKLSIEIIKVLEDTVVKIANKLTEEDKKPIFLCNVESDLEWNSDSEEQMIAVLDRLEKLVESCKNLREKIISLKNTSIKEESETLRFYIIIAHMMGQLIEGSVEQIDYLNDFKELRDDYIRGVERLKGLNDGMCEDTDPLIRQLGEFCKEISNIQNTPYLLSENMERSEALNESSIEFLLNMYYANKRRVAWKIGGK